MKKHAKMENPTQDYSCHFCNQDYKTKPGLKQHKKHCIENRTIIYDKL